MLAISLDPRMVDFWKRFMVDCIQHLCEQRSYDEIIFTAPDGIPFTQKEANTLSLKKNVIVLCGHYKGIDQRIREHLITKEYSIGDVVLSGGELPAMMIVDAIVRLLPGAIGDAGSALNGVLFMRIDNHACNLHTHDILDFFVCLWNQWPLEANRNII